MKTDSTNIHKKNVEDDQKIKEELVESDGEGETVLKEEDVQDDEPMFEDLETTETKLPGGWLKRIIPRKSGASAGKSDAYLYAPDGTIIRQDFNMRL